MEKIFLSPNLVNSKENCTFAKKYKTSDMDKEELKKELEENSFIKYKLIVLFHYLMKEKSNNGSYEYVANEDVGKLYEEMCSYEYKDSDRKKSLSDKSYHQSLKDAKKALCKVLEKKYGKGNGFKKKGSAIAYYEGKDNGLELYKASSKSKWLQDFLTILAMSKDILPPDWQDSFFEHLCDPKVPQRKIIDFGSNLKLKNMHWISQIFEAIIHSNVVKILFNYEYKEKIEVLIAPMHLKRYNDRWYVAGLELKEDGEVKKYDAWAFDRIEKVEIKDKLKCHEQSSTEYDTYFDNIVGIRKPTGIQEEDIYIRTTSEKAHQLIKTKAIHSSQIPTKEFDKTKNEGEFKISVIPNKELQTRILSYGDDIYVVGDGKFQKELKEVITRMAKRYKI